MVSTSSSRIIYRLLLYNSHFSSFWDLAYNALKTPWRRVIDAYEHRKTPRERNSRSNTSLGHCVNTAKWKKKHVQTLWMRSKSAIETKWHYKGLQQVYVQAQSTYLINAWILRLCTLLQRANGALEMLLETLRCCRGDPTSFVLCVYQNAEPWRVLCACSKCSPSHGVL